MSWMLLGNAMTLACDLGVMDSTTTGVATPPKPAALHGQERLWRLRHLLFIYSEQISLQIGSSPLVPQGVQHLVSNPQSSYALTGVSPPQDGKGLIALAELTRLSRVIAESLFQPHTLFQQLVSSGRYLNLVEHFKPNLAQWEGKHISEVSSNGTYPLLAISVIGGGLTTTDPSITSNDATDAATTPTRISLCQDAALLDRHASSAGTKSCE